MIFIDLSYVSNFKTFNPIHNFFPDSIYRSIRLFAKSAPANFYDCVDALPFLATTQNVKHDLPQLVHMLAWTPASPLEVLTYFSKEYQEVILQFS